MNRAHKVLLTLGIAIVLVLVFYAIASTITRITGYVVAEPINDDFAACLEEQDIMLYIYTDDSANLLKNNDIAGYLKNIKIMNCKRNPEACEELGIVNYPTWLINNQIIAGDLSLDDFSEYSECEL